MLSRRQVSRRRSRPARSSPMRSAGVLRLLARLGGIRGVFPDLSERVDGLPADRALCAVNRFTAREVVIVGARLQIGKNPRTDAECALVVWYDRVSKSTVQTARPSG